MRTEAASVWLENACFNDQKPPTLPPPQARPPHKAPTEPPTTAHDWQLMVDFWKQLWFPEAITTTTLGPDSVLLSVTARQVVAVELRVLVGKLDEMEEAKKKKKQEEI